MESLTLDREAMHLKDSLMPRYAELIYYGFWFSPEREMLQALIDKSQEHVEGEVTLKLYKGNVIVIGRSSPKSLYASKIVTFEDDAGAYDQKDAEGFIKLNALRLRLLGQTQALAFSWGAPMWPDTRLLDLFGIELPIVQAPMANATGVEMAVAVAKAGGLGSLPCAMLGTDKIRAGVSEFRAQSNKPLQSEFLLPRFACRGCGARAGLAHATCALLHGARRHTAFAPAEGRVTALRRGHLRADRGAETGGCQLSFRPAGASTPCHASNPPVAKS